MQESWLLKGRNAGAVYPGEVANMNEAMKWLLAAPEQARRGHETENIIKLERAADARPKCVIPTGSDPGKENMEVDPSRDGPAKEVPRIGKCPPGPIQAYAKQQNRQGRCRHYGK